MATKSLVIRVEVDRALKAHNCQANCAASPWKRPLPAEGQKRPQLGSLLRLLRSEHPGARSRKTTPADGGDPFVETRRRCQLR